mmetsp:Transcript_77541/g.116553  ORF Transcript_77541/g.116553 Transcript_77541/m.116553 type:complete len:303 (-) Transcript_77541:491-1399(-)
MSSLLACFTPPFSFKKKKQFKILKSFNRKKINYKKETIVCAQPIFFQKKLESGYISSYKPFSLKKRLEGFLKARKETISLSKYLPGNFNNQNQHLTDCLSKNKKINSHEHIHCFIEKVDINSNGEKIFLAQYFFPSPSPKLFRLRLYVIYPCEFSTKEKPLTKMEIIRNSENNWKKKGTEEFISGGKARELFEYGTSLSNCLIFWKQIRERNGKQNPLTIFHGFMENRGCTILTTSSLSFLHVNDDLVLSPHSLWVNDRGFKEDGNLLYGSKNKISFQMERMKTGNFFHWSFGGNFPKHNFN